MRNYQIRWGFIPQEHQSFFEFVRLPPRPPNAKHLRLTAFR